MKFEKLKRLGDAAKNMKPADAKRKAPKTFTPPGTKARKAGVAVTWSLFIMVVAYVLLNLLFSSNEPQAIMEAPEANQAATPAAVEFAKRFANDFFTWEASTDGFTERQANLAPYMASGLDPDGGLEISGQRWNGSAGKVDVLHVEETGDNQALVTVRAEQTLTLPAEDEDDKDEKKTVRHVLAVPLAYNNGLALYELPSFAAPPRGHEVERFRADGENAAHEDIEPIEGFMQTFFQSYVNDTPDKLAYFMTGDNVQGLEGSKELGDVSVQDIRVAGEGWTVLASAELIEPETETTYTSHYHLHVVQEGGRYLVQSINKGAK